MADKSIAFKNTKGGYNEGDEIKISLYEEICDICFTKTMCLTMDGSQGEYYNGAICKGCIDNIFKES